MSSITRIPAFRFTLIAWAALGGMNTAVAEKVYFNGSDFKAGYYLIPEEMPADGSKAWVVVDVHGAGGLRNEGRGPGLAKLLAPEPVIVIVPSFTTGYQGGDGKWAEQMIDNFKAVQGSHAVHDKMFLHGHSGGGQFVHRFAFEEPKYVIGVSAHSSGSWACDGGYGSISSKAKGIPFTISCGENDKAHSVAGAPFTRIEWYRRFATEMEKKGFVVAGNTWPGVGHGVSDKLYGPQLKECFLLATRGLLPESDRWKGDTAKLAEANRREYGRPETLASSTSPRTVDLSAVRAAEALLTKGQSPDLAATMRFLARHPASTWAEGEEFSKLKAHCKQAAETYLLQQKEAGTPLSGAGLERFAQATAGLGIGE